MRDKCPFNGVSLVVRGRDQHRDWVTRGPVLSGIINCVGGFGTGSRMRRCHAVQMGEGGGAFRRVEELESEWRREDLVSEDRRDGSSCWLTEKSPAC